MYVRLGAEHYALPVGHVLEIVGADAVWPLPGSGPHVVGLRNLRGQALPVFDLAAMIGAADGDGPPARICVTSRGGALAGFGVDEVTDVAGVPEGGDAAAATLLARSTLVDGRLVGVVDMDALFAELERRGGT